MNLVIDTNIIISALLKDSFIRKIILNKHFNLITPSYTLSEIMKYKEEIARRTGISELEFDILIDKLFDYIKIINKDYYSGHLEECSNIIEDKKDIPFLALACLFKCPIWSDDKHFKKQNKVSIITTKDMIELIK